MCLLPSSVEVSTWLGENSRASCGSQVWCKFLAPMLPLSGLGSSGWVGWGGEQEFPSVRLPSLVLSLFLEFNL